MKDDNRRSHRRLVRELEHMPAVTVEGQTLTGDYLAQLVSVRYDPPAEAADDTPQLVTEIGRIVARAKAQLDRAELEYRIWRDSLLHDLTNSLEKARAAGFASVCDPGVDSRNKPKPEKLPTKADVEAYLRTLPEYREHWERQIKAQEAWSTVHMALEASQLRTVALNISTRWGLRSPETASDNRRTTEGEPYQPAPLDTSTVIGTCDVPGCGAPVRNTRHGSLCENAHGGAPYTSIGDGTKQPGIAPAQGPPGPPPPPPPPPIPR